MFALRSCAIVAVVGLAAVTAAAAQGADDDVTADTVGRRVGNAHAHVPSVTRNDFLPMPMARPMTLPQREGPGVIVARVRAGGAVAQPGEAEADAAAVTGPTPASDDAQTLPLTPLSQTLDGQDGPVITVIPEMTLAATETVAPPVSLAHFAFGAYQRGLYGTALEVALVAAADDDPHAAALIGRLYEEAQGVEQDFDKAAGWYAVASDLGDIDATYRLATLLLLGRGLPKDPVAAADAFEVAAKAGNADAAYALALLHLQGEGRPRDEQAAFRFMRAAAEGGNLDAQSAIAIMYEEGEGTAPNDEAATQWYGRAAAAGDMVAAVNYAIRLFNGVGTDADVDRAAEFFAQAARAGNPVGMNRLARILAHRATTRDEQVEAVKWHLLARASGVSDLFLDGFMGTRTPDIVEEAERRAAAFVAG